MTVEALEDRTVPSTLAPVRSPGAVAGIVSALAAASEQSFQASGTFAFTDSHVGTVSGQATPFGAFTGTFSNQDCGEGKLVGTTTFNFGSGSLTISYDVRLDHDTNQFVGTYQITGGTGALADATGSATARNSKTEYISNRAVFPSRTKGILAPRCHPHPGAQTERSGAAGPMRVSLDGVRLRADPGLRDHRGVRLIACEQAGHNACLVELDPLYCDVIAQRYRQFTGKAAQRRPAA